MNKMRKARKKKKAGGEKKSRPLLAIFLVIALFAASGASGFAVYHLLLAEDDEIPPVEEKPPPPDPYDMEVLVGTALLAWKPKALAELEADSEYIIRGYLLPNQQNKVEYSDDLSSIRRGFTLSALVVSESYKGPLLPGDRIPFIERYYYQVNESSTVQTVDGVAQRVVQAETVLVTVNNYMPTPPKQEFIFFLNRQPFDFDVFPGCYFLKTIELGRYPCLTVEQIESGLDALDNKTLGLNMNTSDPDKKAYLAIFQEIVDKFTGSTDDVEGENEGETGEEA